ncbi:MAG: glycosyltransferase [archaeon]|nr:glycosyltransferase [archaeon]
MLVSIAIGALNEENYIGTTLASAFAQKTRHSFEVIVGDGYSEDATEKIAKKAGARVVFEKRRSAAFQRQAAANSAKGKIIAFTDADAQLPSYWIERAVAQFEADSKLVMLYGPVYFSDTPSWERSASKLVMDLYLPFLAFFGFHNPVGSNIVVRRSAFEKIRGFDTSLVTAEDLDLAKRMKKIGRVKFCLGVDVSVSARRVKKWGYLKFTFFHIINGIKYQLTGNAAKNYEPVR